MALLSRNLPNAWKRQFARALRTGLNLSYLMLRGLRRKDNKVVFLSRQTDGIPYDFDLAIEKLAEQYPEIEVKALGGRLNPDSAGEDDYLSFASTILRSLYHLATSKVAVLDAYWPAVSMVNLGQEITVFQMWHSLGKVKKSGLATVGMRDGRSEAAAREYSMHEGYDYVFAGAPAWNKAYIESFPVEEKQILNTGLPRAAYLVNEKQTIASNIRAAHPELEDGKVVLYAPTFRRGGGTASGARAVVDALNRDGWQVVVKGHANQPLLAPDGTFHDISDFSAPELLTVADYLITDYSAIAVEGALLDVPTHYYLYDFDDYTANNGLNIDLEAEMGPCVHQTTGSLRRALQAPYPRDLLAAYKEKYVLDDPANATGAVVEALVQKGGLCRNA